jgi:hypothetical protein
MNINTDFLLKYDKQVVKLLNKMRYQKTIILWLSSIIFIVLYRFVSLFNILLYFPLSVSLKF